MRWRFVDGVASYEAWKRIAARKAVSFEESSLLDVFGRKGVFPESLLVECRVEAVRWLVAASSGFAQVSALAEIDAFAFDGEIGAGAVLEIAADVKPRADGELIAECRVDADGTRIAGGALAFALLPLAENFDREFLAGMWKELYGAA